MPGLEVAPCAFAATIDHDDLLSDHPKAPPGYKVLGRLGQGTFGEVRGPFAISQVCCGVHQCRTVSIT